MSADRAHSTVRLIALVSGTVQGVGFRRWVADRGVELGLTGQARNLPDGRVQVIAEGDESSLLELVSLVRSTAAPGVVEGVDVAVDQAVGGLRGFTTG